MALRSLAPLLLAARYASAAVAVTGRPLVPSNLGQEVTAKQFVFVFATVCTHNADVSSEVLQHAFWRSGTRGSLRRMDRCPDRGYKYPQPWLDSYRIHPYWSEHGEEDSRSMLLNKVWLLTQWIGEAPKDSTVVILDLDMIPTSPMERLFQGASSPFGEESGTRGKPIGGKYLLGSNAWKQCKPDVPGNDCALSADEGAEHYNVGPPQAIHVDDLKLILPMWLSETERMIDSGEAWALDMDAYVVAAASHGLRHGNSPRLFVSNAAVGCDDEAWAQLSEQLGCELPEGPAAQRPVLHYCQFYTTNYDAKDSDPDRKVPGRFFGKYEFSKRHGGHWADIDPFACGAAPAQLELDSEHLNEVISDSTSDPVRRRHAFMVLEVVSQHNAAYANYWSRCEQTDDNVGQSTDVSLARTTQAATELETLSVAFAVSVLSTANDSLQMEQYLDGAAVLARSVATAHANSKGLIIDMVAFVPPEATAPKERLAAFGYRDLEAPSPVQREQVRGKYLRETFEDSGCCGSLELLKLRAYELVEQRVITGYCAALGLGMPAHVLLSYPSKQTMF